MDENKENEPPETPKARYSYQTQKEHQPQADTPKRARFLGAVEYWQKQHIP